MEKKIFFNSRDRLRTSINVLGDAYGAAIVEHLSKDQLKKLDDEAEKECAQILAASQFQNICDRDTSCTSFHNTENNNTNGTKINRVCSVLDDSSFKMSQFSSLNAMYRPPSLNVISAIRKKSRYPHPMLASPLSYQTIPYIHAESETNV